MSEMLIKPHQRCGYSNLPFARKDTFLYCRVWKWVGGGGQLWVHTHKRKLSLRKKHFVVIEKYVEDIRQGQKSGPDLVGSITKAPCLLKE